MTLKSEKFDFILVGGGLQAGLMAGAIKHYKPASKILIVEKNQRLFGNHTWSFHRSDLATEWAWISKIPMSTWPGYSVNFPGVRKRVDIPYCSISSQEFGEFIVCSQMPGFSVEIKTGVTVHELSADHITTSNGRFEGQTIVDCRGRSPLRGGIGYQKFFGLEISLRDDWPDSLPTLMEANIDQTDGFRFLYVLPFEPRRVLIEDTCFSENNQLNIEESEEVIGSYLREKQVPHWDVIRKEQGCLPMPFASEFRPGRTNALAGGYAGGWFHAATGFSFPLSAKFADIVASSPSEKANENIRALANQNRFQSTFSMFLNRLLFHLVPPKNRFVIFQRFYTKLPKNTIERFYAHAFTKTDACRILMGSPPSGLTPIKFLKSYKEKTCVL